MGYQFTIGENGEIPLLDEICRNLDIELGDILCCEVTKDKTLTLQKHEKQTLTDAQIQSSGKLTRVVEYIPEDL